MTGKEAATNRPSNVYYLTPQETSQGTWPPRPVLPSVDSAIGSCETAGTKTHPGSQTHGD
jgi:hypothetical protein